MVDLSSFVPIILIVGIMGVIFRVLIGVSILAEIFRYIGKKKGFETSYGKAWLVILIPYLIISLLSILISLIGSEIVLTIWKFVSFFIFIGILTLSMKLIYKEYSDYNVWKTFSIVYAIILIILFGLSYFLSSNALYNPLEANVPQMVCTKNCGFAYSPRNNEPIIVGGYKEYPGKDRALPPVFEETFDMADIEGMKTGKIDTNGRERIIGELDGDDCVYIYITSESGGTTGSSCR